MKRLPRFTGREPGLPVLAGTKALRDEAITAIALLDRSYLFMQGPPGSGKTFTGSLVVVELLRCGKRVGITANSHKAIHHLLSKSKTMRPRKA